MELKDIKKFLEELNQDKIIFDAHFYKRTSERPIDESMIRSFLSQVGRLKKVEKGKGQNRFKLWFKMSRKYFLALIIEIIPSKDLKIISAWNSNRKWQEKLK